MPRISRDCYANINVYAKRIIDGQEQTCGIHRVGMFTTVEGAVKGVKKRAEDMLTLHSDLTGFRVVFQEGRGISRADIDEMIKRITAEGFEVTAEFTSYNFWFK